MVIACTVCVCVFYYRQVHYSSSISFLNFDEVICDDSHTSADDSQLSLEDNGDIEGCVNVLNDAWCNRRSCNLVTAW